MRIWIDIDNAPHALIMEPIIEELERRGHQVLITARDYGNTRGLLDMKGFRYFLIGRHPGKSGILKILHLGLRMVRLFIWAMDKNIDIAFAHGSRSQVIPARLLGIPVVTMYDYEHISDFIFRYFANIILMPFVFKDLLKGQRKFRVFPGLKEELYIWEHEYIPDWGKGLSLDREKIVVVRPPASMAHYHNPVAEKILNSLLSEFASREDITVIVVPRTGCQRKEIMKKFGRYKNVIVLEKEVDGISMLKDADLVISGGGTMNREAALLGKPVYSIFQGKKGEVDKWLENHGRLRFIQEGDSINIDFNWKKSPLALNPDLKNWIVDFLLHFKTGRI